MATDDKTLTAAEGAERVAEKHRLQKGSLDDEPEDGLEDVRRRHITSLIFSKLAR